MIAAKQSADAAKALTGDIYVRRWTTVRGKGKKATPVEHEVRVNAATACLVAVGAAATAVGAGVALWLTQMKLKPVKGKAMVYTVVCPFGKDGMMSTGIVYNSVGVPVGKWTPNTPWETILSDRQRNAGWYVVDFTYTSDAKGVTYRVNLKNDDKTSFELGERSGFKINMGL